MCHNIQTHTTHPPVFLDNSHARLVFVCVPPVPFCAGSASAKTLLNVFSLRMSVGFTAVSYCTIYEQMSTHVPTTLTRERAAEKSHLNGSNCQLVSEHKHPDRLNLHGWWRRPMNVAMDPTVSGVTWSRAFTQNPPLKDP